MNIVAAIDFSSNTPAVLTHAIRMSKAFGARLHLVHVEDSAPYFAGPEGEPSPEPVNERMDLDAIRKKVSEENITADFEQVEGPIADNIMDISDRVGADYIIVGSRPHGRLYHILFGVPSESIVHRSRCPVLIVPYPTDGRG